MSAILITGGTGTLGRALSRELLTRNEHSRIIIYSRDELKQADLHASLMNFPNRDQMRYFLGDVRDASRLGEAMRNVDEVIHAAALKRVDAVSYNPHEAIKTNILGSQNVITEAIKAGVKTCLAVSTDKAVNPTTLYGVTKLTMEHLWETAKHRAGGQDISFPIIRYGNVFGSRGSVIPIWENIRNQGGTNYPMGNPEATRFTLTITDAVDYVLHALDTQTPKMVPLLKAYRLGDLAEAFGTTASYQHAPREGDKLHEELTPGESSKSAEKYTVEELKKMIEDWRAG